MIVSFRQKGLEALFRTGSTRGVQTSHVAKLRRMLALLDVAVEPRDLDLPGFRLHGLKGDRKGQWSMSVSGNWRVTFRFKGLDIELVDYLDYH